ncbi:MAG: hypothetical protein ACRDKE_05735 [Solirubrobacterales bacterium]
MAELTSAEATRQRIVMILHDILSAHSRRPAQSEYLRAELSTLTSIGVIDDEEAAVWTRQVDRAEELAAADQFAHAETRELARNHLTSLPPEPDHWDYAFNSAQTVYGLGKILTHRELSTLESERYKADDEHEGEEDELIPLVRTQLIPGGPPYHYGVVVTAIECCEHSVVFHWHGVIEEWANSGRLNGNEVEITDDLGTQYSWDGRPFHAELSGELLGSTAFTPAVPGEARELFLRAREIELSWSLQRK